ncbi:unnamed protein product [Pylaiella littoralis]
MTMETQQSQQLHNQADIEKALTRFAEASVSSPTNPPGIPSELEGVLREIAKVGVPYYGWGGLKELFAAQMVEAVGALEKDSGFLRSAGGKDYQQRRDELVASLRSFDAAPFTLQRLAEVLQDPRRQYSTTHKLINGLERLLSVSSTLPTTRREGGSAPAPAPTATASASAAATPTTATTAAAEATPTVILHDAASNGAAIAAAAAAATAVAESSSSSPSSSSAVAVEVEERRGGDDSGETNGTVDAALVPVDDESTAQGGGEGWEAESSGKRGPGRKRLKVDVKPEAPVMSE